MSTCPGRRKSRGAASAVVLWIHTVCMALPAATQCTRPCFAHSGVVHEEAWGSTALASSGATQLTLSQVTGIGAWQRARGDRDGGDIPGLRVQVHLHGLRRPLEQCEAHYRGNRTPEPLSQQLLLPTSHASCFCLPTCKLQRGERLLTPTSPPLTSHLPPPSSVLPTLKSHLLRPAGALRLERA